MDRTPWNPDWSQAIARVGALVESLFACRVKFQTVESFLESSQTGTQPSFLQQDLVFFESTLFDLPKMIRGTRPGLFAFPIRIRRAGAAKNDVSLVGVATIEGLAASDDARLHQLGEFLQMAAESRIEAFERLLDVERQERTLLEQADVRENSKVVRLFPRNSKEETEESFRLRSYEDGLNLTTPLLLMGPAKFPFNRIALEIFNRTSLWFFVNIEDLSEEAFQSAQSFRDLGRMCIFIADLAKLPIEKQLRLAEVFGASEPGTDAPRLITVLNDTPATLVGSGVLLPHLLALLTPVEIDPMLTSTPDPSAKAIRTIVQGIEARLKSPDAFFPPETKASNLIPIHGRWQRDDGSNPTFH